MLALLLIHIAAVPPVHIARCGDVVIAENQIIEGEQVVLHADCGGRVEVRGTVRAQKQLRIVAAGIDVSGRLLAGQGDIFLVGGALMVVRWKVEDRTWGLGGECGVACVCVGDVRYTHECECVHVRESSEHSVSVCSPLV